MCFGNFLSSQRLCHRNGIRCTRTDRRVIRDHHDMFPLHFTDAADDTGRLHVRPIQLQPCEQGEFYEIKVSILVRIEQETQSITDKNFLVFLHMTEDGFLSAPPFRKRRQLIQFVHKGVAVLFALSEGVVVRYCRQILPDRLERSLLIRVPVGTEPPHNVVDTTIRTGMYTL